MQEMINKLALQMYGVDNHKMANDIQTLHAHFVSKYLLGRALLSMSWLAQQACCASPDSATASDWGAWRGLALAPAA